MRIKAKMLIAMVGLTTITLLIGGTVFLNFTIDNLENEMIIAHQQQTDVIARGIKGRLEDEKRILEQIANTEIARSMDPGQADA